MQGKGPPPQRLNHESEGDDGALFDHLVPMPCTKYLTKECYLYDIRAKRAGVPGKHRACVSQNLNQYPYISPKGLASGYRVGELGVL